MLFNSLEFIAVFLPVTLLLYFLLAPRAPFTAKVFLTGASLLFYVCNSVSIGWLTVSLAVNFIAGRSLAANKGAKGLYIAAAAINVTLLLTGKYLSSITVFSNFVFFTGFRTDYLVPLGISFITLQQLLFLKECYDGKVQHLSLADYLLFILFFPKLLAGPFTGYSNFISQADHPAQRPDYTNIASGMVLFFIGLAKKNLLSGLLEPVVQASFQAQSLNIGQAWMASLSNTFYIFFDMSAWVDMAMGAALMFNVVLPPNFRNPYAARNIREFWERWNITVTGAFMTLIYRPLQKRMLPALLLTFTIMALWYSFTAAALAWGLMNALAVYAVERSGKWVRIPGWISWLITFGFINVSLLFLTADSISAAMVIIKGMLSIKSLLVYYNEWYILWAVNANYITGFIILASLAFALLSLKPLGLPLRTDWKRLIAFACLAVIAILTLNQSGFIYLSI